ncbi:hypothetical protein FDUTEX481_01471 [Tolypothrix sp. PCC 7601]|nr:hypothetical protein FDUTEX481_01471 [Tolypothrix sp. PCC 7601]
MINFNLYLNQQLGCKICKIKISDQRGEELREWGLVLLRQSQKQPARYAGNPVVAKLKSQTSNILPIKALA